MARLKKLSSGQKFCEFPPNCLQFKALCLAFYDDLRLPKTSDAYHEIRQRAYSANPYWSHPVVKFTANRLPTNFLSIEKDHEAYPKFKKAYEEVCHLVKQGHSIPDIAEPVMVQKSSDRAVAQRHLKHIKEFLGAKV